MKKYFLLAGAFALMALVFYGVESGTLLKGVETGPQSIHLGSGLEAPVLTLIGPEPPTAQLANEDAEKMPTAYLNIIGPDKPKPLDGQGVYFNIVGPKPPVAYFTLIGPNPPRPMLYPNPWPVPEEMGF